MKQIDIRTAGVKGATGEKGGTVDTTAESPRKKTSNEAEIRDRDGGFIFSGNDRR